MLSSSLIREGSRNDSSSDSKQIILSRYLNHVLTHILSRRINLTSCTRLIFVRFTQRLSTLWLISKTLQTLWQNNNGTFFLLEILINILWLEASMGLGRDRLLYYLNVSTLLFNSNSKRLAQLKSSILHNFTEYNLCRIATEQFSNHLNSKI